MTPQHLATISPFPTAAPAATPSTARSARVPRWAFLPFIAITIVHVAAQAVGSAAVAAPTKLLLMPALAFAVLLCAAGIRSSAPVVLLLAALTFSWLGDGAGTFVPFLPTVPMMLVFFGIAHLLYVLLFWRHVPTRAIGEWSTVYAAWWLSMLIAIAPRAGTLAIAVALYGILLGATAVFSTRCVRAVTLGGAFFLTSDTVLAFEIFLPDAVQPWMSPVVMATYCTGQGLIVAGVLATLRARQRAH